MADRIKGITIEINGDTTKLEEALKKANSELKSSQSNLKDIDRLLKMDPGNTELLQQKYKNLGDAIGEAKDKLKILQDAQQQMKDAGKVGTEEYDALQREIVETEQKVKSLTEEYRNFGSVSSQQIKAAGENMQKIGDKISTAGSAMTKTVTAPIVGLGTAAVKITADFDSSMSEVAAISGATGDDFEALRAKAREMGAQTKFSASEAADAMKYMAMAGWKTEEMLNGVSGIMNLAAASGEDLATTSDIVTDALSAFKMQASDSGHFADVLAAASANANTNVSMMGESFKYVAPIAGGLGYNAEDVAVALGIMANSGIKASQAGTTLRSIITRLADPTDAMKKYMKAWGISLEDADGNVKSLMDTMVELRTKFNGLGDVTDEQIQKIADLESEFNDGKIGAEDYDVQMEKLMLSIYGVQGAQVAAAASTMAGKYAMSGFLSLMNASEDEFNKLTEAVYDSDGACQNMADVMQDNLTGQLTILKSQLQELAISFGDIIIPVVREFVGHLQELVTKFNSMDEGTKQMIVKFAAIAAAVGPVLLVVGKLVSGIGTFMTIIPKIVGLFGGLTGGISSIGGVLGALASPVGIVIGIVAALAAAFVYLWNTNEDFRNSMMETWNKIVETCKPLIEQIMSSLKELWEKVLKPFLQFIADAVAPVFEVAFRLVGDLLAAFLKTLSGVIEFIVGVFTGDWARAWEGIKTFFTGIFEGILAYLKARFDLFKSIFDKGMGAALDIVNKVLKKITDAFNDKMEKAKAIVGAAVEIFKKIFNFDWKLPDIKLPHFSIDGEFSLNPPSIPTISIDWYKKAMDDGMILTSPTIFGMRGGSFLGGGEAGPEAVVGVQSLREMITDAVAAGGYGGNITIPVYIGNKRIDTVVIDALQRNNHRSGGH